MKRVILSPLLLIFFITAYTQSIKYGLTAGATFGSQRVQAGNIGITADSRIGFTIGGLADIPIAAQFVFQPALNFTQKSSRFSIFQDGEGVEATQTLNYIELPLNVLFRTDAGKGKFFAGAGPSLAFGISGHGKTKTTFSGQTEEESSSIKFGNNETEDDYKPLDFGGTLITGYELNNGAFIALNYNFGFSDIALASEEASIKNKYFGVRVGFKFGGKGKK